MLISCVMVTMTLEDHLAKWVIVLTTSHDNLEIAGSIPGCVQFLCKVHIKAEHECRSPASWYGLTRGKPVGNVTCRSQFLEDASLDGSK